MELLRLNELVRATIVKRPSKHIKSPYVADIIIEHEIEKESEEKTKKEYLGHTPSLGCCGLAEKDSIVWVNKLGEKTKCDYRIQLSEINTKGHTIYISIAPKNAEEIVHNALRQNLIQNLEVKSVNREKTIKNSRFDFMGKTKDDNYYICEVKSVPLADYVDMAAKEKQKMNFDNLEYNQKISYFPDGYRKKKGAVVSERALKHIKELMCIKQEEPSIRCILLFVVQRTDVKWFQPSRLDPIYLEALRKAWQEGVEIKCLQVEWNTEGICTFYSNTLPIMLYDDYNLSL